MIAVLSNGVTNITLPPDIRWIDRFNGVRMSLYKERTISGGLAVRSMLNNSGYPITLESGENSGLITYDQAVEILSFYNAAAMQGSNSGLTLSIDSVVYNVSFEAGGLIINPFIDYCDPQSGDYFTIQMRFYTT